MFLQEKAQAVSFKKTNCRSLHEQGEGLLLVDLVADVVDVSREVVLGVVVDYVADVSKDQILKYAVLQVFQEPVESESKGFTTNQMYSFF